MASYPVYDTDGSLLGNYAWKDIPRLFKDRWYLDKGVFHLKPVILVEDDHNNLNPPRTPSRTTPLADAMPPTEDKGSIVDLREAHKANQPTLPVGDDNEERGQGLATREYDRLSRFEKADGQLIGFFKPTDRSSRQLVENSNHLADGTYITFRRFPLNRSEVLHLIRRSLRQPGLTDRQRDALLEELCTKGPFGRVQTKDGQLISFDSEGEARKRWKDVKVIESRTSKKKTEVRIIVSDYLTNDMLVASLRDSSIDKRLSTDQQREIRVALQALCPDGSAPEPRGETKESQRLSVWEAPQRETQTISATKSSTSVARVQVITAEGRILGTVKRSGINKRHGKWRSDFCTLNDNELLLSPGVAVPSHKPSGLMTALDQAYMAFSQNENGQDRVDSSRLSKAQIKQIRKSRQQLTNERRQRIIERCLEDRNPDCQDYVYKMMLPNEAKEVADIVEVETRNHPELYKEVERYETIKLATLALANDYDRSNSDSTEDLLDRAHLFMFSDEAWWEARSCHEPLTHLPYPVCLIEDVLIWDGGNGIKSRALSPSAVEEAAKYMLSFVVNRCVTHKRSNGSVTYVKPLEALSGHIAVSSIRGPANSKSSIKSETHSSSSPGRSPRPHPRRGHWRNQAYGPGRKLRKRIWISDTIISPSGKAYKITEPTRVHLVTMTDIAE